MASCLSSVAFVLEYQDERRKNVFLFFKCRLHLFGPSLKVKTKRSLRSDVDNDILTDRQTRFYKSVDLISISIVTWSLFDMLQKPPSTNNAEKSL